MFALLPWSVGAKNKKVLAAPVHAEKPEQEVKPISMPLPLSSKTKRKRRESDGSAILHATSKPSKKKPEYMSHVEIARGHGDLRVTPTPAQDFVYKDASGEDCRVVNAGLMELDEPSDHTQHDASVQLDHVQNGDPQRAESGVRTSVDASTMTALQQTVESQFSLEILLKHNELRLIDQELAKCQIALEQLRRCQVIPYPMSTGNVSDMFNVQGGVGPTYGTTSGGLQTPQAAPWGVTDGPYSRHLARWLIPDSVFDGGAVEDAPRQRPAGKKMPQRTTRGAKGENNTPTATSRSQRGSTSSRLQALPAGYPEPKEEKGPMIVKRSTDGKMVKLVCLDCRRENFNSAQGFINHCRIAHSRGFASHDAAALACGEEVEYNEAGGVVGDSGLPPTNVGLVHPLIRSAHVAALASTSSTPKRRKPSHSKSNSANHASEIPGRLHHTVPHLKQRPTMSPDDPFAQMSFVPSSHTPHLSALFATTGRGGDLNEIVGEATTKIILDFDESNDGDEDYEMEDAPEEEQSHSTRGVLRGGRLPARATMSPAPLDGPHESSKGANKLSRKPEYLDAVARLDYASPYTHSRAASNANNTLLLSATPPLNLSPNTIETNPAPSLVSDDDDDYEDPHSESEAPSSDGGEEDEDRYLDIEVEDEEEDVGPSVDPELTTSAKARRIPQATRRRSVLRSAGAVAGERGPTARRVSFRSPTRARGGGGRKGR